MAPGHGKKSPGWGALRPGPPLGGPIPQHPGGSGGGKGRAGGGPAALWAAGGAALPRRSGRPRPKPRR